MSISTTTNIHGGASIEYKRVKFSNFWTHRLTVTTTDGKQHDIDVFAYAPLDLEWLPNELALECRPAPVEPVEVASA
jgi:hypothetical protein